MSDINRIRRRRAAKATTDDGQTVEIIEEIDNPVGDRMPDAVWHLLQGAGVTAANRLQDMLKPIAFKALASKDKMRLIELALSRAYGRPDAGVKRSVQVNLSATGADAVAASLERLSIATDLPEYRGASEHGAETARNDTKQEH
jgi:hypothetical protein